MPRREVHYHYQQTITVEVLRYGDIETQPLDLYALDEEPHRPPSLLPGDPPEHHRKRTSGVPQATV